MMDPEDLIEQARAYAAATHAADVRKGSGIPYFEGHLEPVAHIVAAAGGDAAQIAAAYLHDTAEDHGGQARLDEVTDRFGHEVGAIVADLSDSLADTDAGEDKAPWRPRKEAYIARLAEMPVRSVEVAAADKLHNATAVLDDLRRVGDTVWERFTVADPAAHLWYHRSVATVIGERLGPHPTATALAQVVDDLTVAIGSSG